MQKLSPLMKGLVENRARLDAECIRLSRLIEDLTTKLRKASKQREACDRLITRQNSQVRVAQIQPIFAWQGHYGPRGALRQAIIDQIRLAYPSSISTTALIKNLEVAFGLCFVTSGQRQAWIKNSIKPRLRELANAKVIIRLHDPAANAGVTGVWEWAPEGPPATLASIAAAEGVHRVTEGAVIDPLSDVVDDDLPR